MGGMARLWKFLGVASGLAVLFVVLLALGGGFYAYHRLQAALQPEADAPGAKSIASFANESPPNDIAAYEPLHPFDLDLQNLSSLTPETRPWVRWWWPGADVDADAACTELSKFVDRGIGGVEIQPFTNGLARVEADSETRSRIRQVGSTAFNKTSVT